MQGTPFCLVSEFRKQLFSLSSDSPGLQAFIISKLLSTKFPNDLACPISARPLTVDISIDVNIETALDMHCHVGSWD